MFCELDPGDFSRVAHLFRGHKEYVPVFAVIDGNFPGRIFVDEKDSPNTALVWAISRWAYLDGDPSISSFNQSLPGLVQKIVIPCSRQMNMNWFELYTRDLPEWMARIEKSLGKYKPAKHYEMVYTFDQQKYHSLAKSFELPEGSWIQIKELPILPPVARDAMFVSERFKTKTSFGFELVKEGRIVSVCKSNGLISGKEFMIDVETFGEGDRCKGYATAVGTALIDFCLEEGYSPLWETTLDNIPSRKLASKLGFVEGECYPVYAMEFQLPAGDRNLT
jgi:RimJ/RimL family protein N-acetyltransferase